MEMAHTMEITTKGTYQRGAGAAGARAAVDCDLPAELFELVDPPLPGLSRSR